MKRITALILVFLIFLSGCAAAPELTLSEMLGSSDGSLYTSPFGFSVDAEELYVFTEEELASLNQIDSFTPELLQTWMDTGRAVSIYAAAADDGDSIHLSLYPAVNLPVDVQTAEDYAAYGLSVMPDRLTEAGYTDVQAEQVTAKLGDAEHPAILCTAKLSDDVSYYLLQICFRKDGWMGGLSLSSTESEEAISELLTRITTNN